MITTFDNFLTEGYAGSHQERFNRAIYLHYVEINKDNIFKPVSEKEMYDKLYHTSKMDRIEIKYFNKDDIYRLADKKEIWLSKYGHVVGEVWIEGETYSRDQVKSYWINVKN